MRLVKDLERIISENMTGPSPATMAAKVGKVRPVGREDNASAKLSTRAQELASAKAAKKEEKAVALRAQLQKEMGID